MDPIIDFLAEDRVPDNEKEDNKIRQVAARYWLSANLKLYRRSFGGPYLSCLHPKKVNELLAKLHDGVVRDHAPGPFYDVGPNPREWVESCYCLSKWRFDWLYFSP